MAQPIACQVCGQVPDAHYLLSNRGILPWQFEQMTIGICIGCLIQTTHEWEAALTAAMAEVEAEALYSPESLDAIEEAEINPEPEPEPAPRRKSKTPAASSNGQEDPEAAPAAHD